MKVASTKGNNSKGVAIIGMSCLFPGAPDLATFWSNIVRGVDATRDVTDKEWSLEQYYDPENKIGGLSYSKRGGFITELADFDPLKFGVMPSAVAGGDPDQFLTLKVAVAAMADAGYGSGGSLKAFDGDRAEVILGRISAPGAGSMNFIQQSKTVNELSGILKSILPRESDETIAAIADQIKSKLVTTTADNIPGVMPNVLAGRVAGKLGFRGRSMLIDAACASSMVAVETAVNDLLEGRCDFALAGGVHVNSSAVLFQMFCGLGALSRKDTIRPFDQEADGTLLGEGIGIVCLKRYQDAVRDGDRIYATISGIASSSDGPGSSVLAPSSEGEALAMQKAYDMAGISPRTVQLLEANGTGTPVGDAVELAAVARVFAAGGDKVEPWCAIGSVKSMIGHCQSASAVAGIIKSALALHHKILPPTLNVTTPNTKIDWANHPCYVNSITRPWIKAKNSAIPRRAAVSAFGFGGVNGHMILEEFAPDNGADIDEIIVGETEALESRSLDQVFDSEIFALGAASLSDLMVRVNQLRTFCASGKKFNFKDLAYSVNCDQTASADESAPGGLYLVAIVASSSDDLIEKIDQFKELLGPSGSNISSNKIELDKGIYFTAPGGRVGGKLAFLYPGLGSAYTNMLADLCMHFPEVREVFEIVDNVALSAGAAEPPSKTIFPAPFDKGERALPTLLATADFAVVAVLLAEYAINQLLMHLGIKPDVLMGCSTGEFAAITTTGSVDVLKQAKTFYQLSTRVARSIPEESLANLRTVRILAGWPAVEAMADGPIYLSADLGDEHIIVTGTASVIGDLIAKLKDARLPSQLLPVPIPYHTPLVSSIIDANNEAVRAVDIQPLAIPGWSCSTASKYPQDVEAMRASFVELFTKPIALRRTVQKMYDDGVRIFVEVGPNGILTSSIAGILKEKAHVAVPTNLASRSGIAQINHLLARLHVQSVKANLAFLYKRREPSLIDWRSSAVSAPETKKVLPLTHTALTVDIERLPQLSADFVGNAPADWAGGIDEDFSPGQDFVVETFLSNNASFYSRLNALSQKVMQTYIEVSSETDDPVMSRTAFADGLQLEPEIVEHLSRPFLQRAKIERRAEETVVKLKLDLGTDLYLMHHAIGGAVSTVNKTKVYLVPLMVTLEIMAEAALAHICGGVPIRVEHVKAFKRIVVDKPGVSLKLIAAGDSDRVVVTLIDDAQPSTIYASADFVFANDYADNETKKLSLPLTEPPVNFIINESLYGNAPGKMFHGPLMQAVKKLSRVGNKSINGFASSQSGDGWMPDLTKPNFLLHPMLLDNASQFVLFYLYEKNLAATALLPFLIESVEIFSAPDQLPDEVEVSAILPTLTERATEASLEATVGENVVLRINGINSRRVVLGPEWEKFVYDPKNSMLGTVIPLEPALAGRGMIVKVDQSILPQDDVIIEWCLDYLLTRAEQEVWNDKSKTKKRKMDWLLGRIAAKEAVRKLVKSNWGLSLGPHDVEILSQSNGAPLVVLADEQMPEILVSISHTEGMAVALAAFSSTARPGIDAEIIRQHEPTFASTFLQPHELSYIDTLPREKVDIEITRLWSAKEALFKAAIGEQEMTSFSLSTKPPGESVIEMKNKSGDTGKTYISKDANLVIAYTLG